jgi:exodeoxyribonuclease-3
VCPGGTRHGAAQITWRFAARATSRNRLAVALYVRESRFNVLASAAVRLSVSRHDRLVGGTDERLAAARVLDRGSRRELVLGSFHATPFTDSNGFRRRPVDDAHDALNTLGPGLPTVMADDFNHPILLGMLRRHLKRRGFTVARTRPSTFHREGSIMRGQFDLATTSQLTVVSAVTLPQNGSDHRPVLFTLQYPPSA